MSRGGTCDCSGAGYSDTDALWWLNSPVECNEMPTPPQLHAVLRARKGGCVLYLNKQDKFSRKAANAKPFPNPRAALRHAQSLLRRHPSLHAYRFSIGWVY